MTSLHAALFENLYQEELYQIPPKVLVILSKEWSDVDAEERSVLSKILVAIRQSLASVQIITLHSPFLPADIRVFLPVKVLVFGGVVTGVTNLYEHYETNGLSILVADSIDALNESKKKTLWAALKKMFAV